MSQSNVRRLSWKSHLTGVAMLALSAAGQAVAVPLTVGTDVRVEDRAGNVFTPSPIGSDSNGLYTGVSFLLDGARRVSASAGVFVLNQQPLAGGPWAEFLSFCLEPDVYLTPFSPSYRVDTVAGAGYGSAGNAIGELWGRYRGLVENDVTAAAFQVALWELAYDSTPGRNLDRGHFQLTSGGAVASTAQSWLSSLSLDGSGPQASGLVVLSNSRQYGDYHTNDRQDLLTQTTSVPEPGTLALLALGLAGLAWSQQQKPHRVARAG